MGNAALSEIASLVEAANHVLVISHDRPDGDAIGSSVAVGLITERLGKRIEIVNHDPVPDALGFLPGSDRVTGPVAKSDVDLTICLDAAGRDRIDESVWAVVPPAAPLVNIDHHISNRRFGDVNFVDSAAPATWQLVYELAEAAGWTLDRAIATNLYAAISTDTGSFRYPSTSSRTMRVAGSLLDLGVDPGETNRNLYENFPLRRVEVLSYLLARLKLTCDDQCVSVSLPLEISRSLGLAAGDTEGVIDVIRAIDTVLVAVFFEELPNGKIRVSSRSKEERCSVSEICSHFGGGGHTLAAGARLPGPLDEAEKRFLKQICHKLSEIDLAHDA